MPQKKNLIKKGITVSDFNAFVNSRSFFTPKNRKNAQIYNFRPILVAKMGDVTFCSALGSDGKNLVSKSKASLVICHSSLTKERKKLLADFQKDQVKVLNSKVNDYKKMVRELLIELNAPSHYID